MALGTWQVERRAWKLDLIDRVEARVRAAPVEAPGPLQPATKDDEYRHVRVTGTFLHDRETLVQAVTDLGSGFWVLTPLRRSDGSIVLVNRGFVPPEARDPATRTTNAPDRETTITGLLRLTEPGGGFLRKNDPTGDRWYSRDVQAIAGARGLKRTASYFIDAEAGPTGMRRTWPAGGLTVIAFHNNHLVYALTWYALALMVAGAAVYGLRSKRAR
ncbi:MAG: SURF1 family protein [Variovorax sp.]|nr:MAG: SURF1 family protein [Variovorax sp.]